MVTDKISNIVSIKGYGNQEKLPVSGKYKLARIACRDLTTEFLKKSLSSMLDKVDDVMFEMANKAESSQEQTQYFDAMREIRISRENIEATYISNIVDNFEPQLVVTDVTDVTDLGILSLVDQEALEEELAITNMVSKLQNTCHAALFALDKRMGEIYQDPDLEKQQNPLRPEAICNAFKIAAMHLDEDVAVRLLVYKLYDKYVVSGVAELYQAVNNYLIQQNIVPVIKNEILRRPQQTQHTADNQYGEPDHSIPDPGQPGSYNQAPMTGYNQNGQPMDLASTFHSYLGGNTNVYGTDGLAQQNISAFIPNLTAMQHGEFESINNLSDEVQQQIAFGNINILRSIASSSDFNGEHSADEQTIELVALIFDYILDDEAVASQMKALIGRLQIPMLKVAILDKSLFARKTHPARILLNRLASVALSWNSVNSEADPLFDLVESIVNTILNDFEDQVDIFVASDQKLQNYLDNAQHQAKLRSDRCAKVIEGRERLEIAARDAEDICRASIKEESALPDFIINFVAQYWKEVLRMIHVREGMESERWNIAVQTLETLCLNFDSSTGANEKRQFVRKLPLLVKEINHGIELVSMPNDERSGFLDHLSQWHGQIVSHHTKAHSKDSSPAISHSQSDETISTSLEDKLEATIPSQMEDQAEDFNNDKFEDIEPSSEEAEDDVILFESEPDLMNDLVSHHDTNNIDASLDNLDDDLPSLDISISDSQITEDEPTEINFESTVDPEILKSFFGTDDMEVEEIILETVALPGTEADESVVEIEVTNETEKEDTRDEFYFMAATLKLGHWVEFQQDDGNTIRAHLTWISQSTGSYLFTDRQGRKVSEKTIRGLAVEFKRGAARVLEHAPLFDRAISNLVEKFQKPQTL